MLVLPVQQAQSSFPTSRVTSRQLGKTTPPVPPVALLNLGTLTTKDQPSSAEGHVGRKRPTTNALPDRPSKRLAVTERQPQGGSDPTNGSARLKTGLPRAPWLGPVNFYGSEPTIPHNGENLEPRTTSQTTGRSLTFGSDTIKPRVIRLSMPSNAHIARLPPKPSSEQYSKSVWALTNPYSVRGPAPSPSTNTSTLPHSSPLIKPPSTPSDSLVNLPVVPVVPQSRHPELVYIPHSHFELMKQEFKRLELQNAALLKIIRDHRIKVSAPSRREPVDDLTPEKRTATPIVSDPPSEKQPSSDNLNIVALKMAKEELERLNEVNEMLMNNLAAALLAKDEVVKERDELLVHKEKYDQLANNPSVQVLLDAFERLEEAVQDATSKS